jgi:hypothetical protein
VSKAPKHDSTTKANQQYRKSTQSSSLSEQSREAK